MPEALDAVRAGEADAALVPLENSIGGAEGVTLDELANGAPLVITREVVLPVDFVLAARPAIAVDEHQHGRGPPPGGPPVPGLAARPRTRRRRGGGALQRRGRGRGRRRASTTRRSARRSGPSGNKLAVLAKEIADHADAVTRFALVARPGPAARRRPATT